MRAISEADFVSFDYELTGLHDKNERYVGIAQSYEAHCNGVQKFLPIQLGICAAKYRDNQWILTPASIYIFPNASGTNQVADESVGTVFSVSTSALNFLSSNGFDFNEWISHGLSWMSPTDEQDRRALIQSRIDEIKSLISQERASASSSATPSQSASINITNQRDKEAIDSLKDKIDFWLKSEPNDCLEIPMDSAFLRLLAHTVIAQDFPQLFSHSVRRGEDRVLCVYRERSGLFKEQLNSLYEELERLDSIKGVRAVFDTMSKNKTTLVGHNCFYDLLHTYQSFYGQVPPYIDQFKQKWTTMFPRTFDTKYLAEANDVLGGLQPPATLKGLCDFMIANKSMESLVRVEPIGEDFIYHLPNSSKADLSHDAGYDAMMTSLVFILQLSHIIERKSLEFENIEFGLNGFRGDQKIPIHELLRTACNRVRLVKTQPPSINLKERE
jgi:poly(A)-specific ribonuclease